MRLAALLVLVLAMAGISVAQEQPVVRVEVTPDTVNVGESVQVRVTVLVPTWFTRPPTYPSFELANAITRLPPDSSFPTSERVGKDTWSGIIRDYRIYPLVGATYRFSGKTIEVNYAQPGAAAIRTAVTVPDIVFRGEVPAGAEGLSPYIAGTSLDLSLDVDGDTTGLEAGDALVLRYTAELQGLPAIFLPPLAPDLEFAGVSVYADVPDVEDGDVARRSEKVTLVFDAGGEFSIPGKELSFWNTQSQSIETVTADGLVVSVAGPPAASTVEEDSTEHRWQTFAGLVVGAVVLVLVLWRGLPVFVRRYREAAERRRMTEDYAFKQLLRVLDSGNSAEAYRALLYWVERLEPGMSTPTFASRYGDQSLSSAIVALSAEIYGDASGTGNLSQLRGGLTAARRRYFAHDSDERARHLPPLNP